MCVHVLSRPCFGLPTTFTNTLTVSLHIQSCNGSSTPLATCTWHLCVVIRSSNEHFSIIQLGGQAQNMLGTPINVHALLRCMFMSVV